MFKSLVILFFLLVSLMLPAQGQPAGKAKTSKHQTSSQQVVQSFDIPIKSFKLANGLTVIVNEDHKQPIVGINVWYHVGAKDESEGKEGFAHLFEHLLFKGTENFDQDYAKAYEEMGATKRGGTTWYDRTNYYAVVPVGALDRVLFLESERMHYVTGALTKEKLDKEIGVVKSERRRTIDDPPYGKVKEIIARATYPKDHPYSRLVVGNMKDLESATLDDVKEWYKKYYTPTNAVIVISGDIDSASAHQKTEKYFGAIPSGPALTHLDKWVAKREEEKREVLIEKVPSEKLFKVWNVPEWRDIDYHLLQLVANMLTGNERGRLNKRLVEKEKLASSVLVQDELREISNQFIIEVTAKNSLTLPQIEKVLDEELSHFVKDGPSADELNIAKADYISSFIRGNERLVHHDWAGRTDVLATAYTYAGDALFYKRVLAAVQQATTEDIKRVLREWLNASAYVLEVRQQDGGNASTASSFDRSQLPKIDSFTHVALPKVQETVLPNGLKIVLMERHEMPLVYFAMNIGAGVSADQHALPGTATLVNRLLSTGTKTRTAEQINKERALLGATLETELVSGFVLSPLYMSRIRMSAIKSGLTPSLQLFSDILQNPSFAPDQIEVKKSQRLNEIKEERLYFGYDHWRNQVYLLFGEKHLQNNGWFTGLGNEQSLAKIQRKDLIDFHHKWYRPNNATLVVAGDITMTELKPLIEKLFGNWQKAPVPERKYASVPVHRKRIIYLIDQPGKKEAFVNASLVLPSTIPQDDIALDMMSNMIGGSFGARLNQNLRVRKGWGYYAYTSIWGAPKYRTMDAYTAVQADKASEAVLEILNELKGFTSGNPPTQKEFDDMRSKNLQSFVGRLSSTTSMAGILSDILGIKELSSFINYQDALKQLTLEEVKARAKEVLKTDEIIWFISGDRSKIEQGIKSLNLGEVIVIDANGNSVK